MVRFYLLGFVLMALSTMSNAQTLSVTVSKNPVETGEEFEVSFTLNTGGGGFIPPAFNDFAVLSGPNQSSSTQFINGVMSQSITLSYVLAAKREGKLTIGPAAMDVGNKRINSAPVNMTVLKPGGVAGKQKQADPLAGSVFLKVSVSKSNPYLGESVLVAYKLCTKVNLVNYSIEKLPALNGFWSQEIDIPQLQFKVEEINGVRYNVADIRKIILFPQRAGLLEIDPIKGEAVARVQVKRQRSNDPFSQFFNDPFFGMGTQDVKLNLVTETVRIHVKDLPSGAPEGFSGAVGNFKLEAFLDKPSTKTNDPVTLKVKISGSGNLKLLEPPMLNFPADIESYDPKTSDNISVASAGVSGSRTYEYLLVPRHAGEFKIPPVVFSFFSLDKKEFVALSGPEMLLSVAKGDETAETIQISGISKDEVELLGKDIRYIKTGNPHWKVKEGYFLWSGLFWLWGTLPLLGFVIFLAWYRSREKEKGNLILMKSRRANALAKKRLSLSRKLMKAGEKEKFFEEISRALWGFIGDKLGIFMADLSKENALEKMKEKGVPNTDLDAIRRTLEKCEMSRFAPGADLEMQELYASTLNLISGLEKNVK